MYADGHPCRVCNTEIRNDQIECPDGACNTRIRCKCCEQTGRPVSWCPRLKIYTCDDKVQCMQALINSTQPLASR